MIYWGDIDGYSEERPMNLLAENVYEFYQQKGIQVLDIGPSTENGVPNYGLCDFKESIGVSVLIKVYFKKIFSIKEKRVETGENILCELKRK